MTHARYKEWLLLAVANEISNDDMRSLKTHLAECEPCRHEFQELRQMMTVLGEGGVKEPSDEMLWEARRNLRVALERETPMLSMLTRETQSVAPRAPHSTYSPSSSNAGFLGWFSGFRVAFAGAAAVAVGVFVGYLAFSGQTVQAPMPSDNPQVAYEDGRVDQALGGPAIENVRFINRDEKAGEVEIEYDLVRPIRLRADVSDERMQRVLASAVMHSNNAGTRLRAIDALDMQGKRFYDEDVKMALIQALQSDSNAGVRKHSLDVLSGMPFDRDIKDACLYVLANDGNPGLRVASIDLLSKASLDGHVPQQEILDFMNTTLTSDGDAFLRAHSSALIEEVSDEK
jgi:hypothetical protein